MDVSVEDLGPVEKSITVELPWDEVKAKLDEAYKEVAKHFTIKGFRRGKVPRQVMEKLFGAKLVKEVAKELVKDSFPKAVADNGVHVVAEPVVEDDGIETGKSFKYRARVEVAPEIEPKDYFGLQSKRVTQKIDDELVEADIERRREQAAEYRAIEGRENTQVGDVLQCDLMGKVGDKPFSVEDVYVEADPEAKRAIVPGIGRAAIGLAIAEKEHELSFDIPDNVTEKELAGQKVKLLATIKDVREKRVPELDDEFAKDTGEADTLDDLRKVVRRRLEEVAKRSAEREMREELTKQLLAKNEFEVSPALVERQVDVIMARAQMQLQAQGVDLKQMPAEFEKMREGAREGAADTVRATLLLEAIAKKEGVEVVDADIEKRVAEIAAAQGRGGNVARVKAELQKEGRADALKLALREEKTLDLLVSKATIVAEEPASK